MPDFLLFEQRGEVCLVTLNRPDKRNALSIELRLEIADVFGRIAGADAVACVVLTGAGTAFCSGMDTTQFGGDAENRRRLVESSVAAFGAVGRCSIPVIAAVNGPAIAGGFALALLSDIRIASETALFGFPDLPAGIPPAYAAARAALGTALARELCLTGRVLEADEALRRGVVSAVHSPPDLMPQALELAGSVAAAPRRAVLETKRRVLIEREQVWGPLFEREEQALREALLGEDG
jgi:enoyl-CoA hydratase